MEIIKSSNLNIDSRQIIEGSGGGGSGCSCHMGKVEICNYSLIECFIHW
ncbi:hypothetical protein [Clostridium baratii]|nr:hypothetical protein [Clostridium baratii]